MAKSKTKKTRDSFPNIKVVGVGGAGGNAVSRMAGKIRGVELVAINTDLQDLNQTLVRRRLQIGKTVTHGLGAGMNPELGRQAAEENRDDIAKIMEGADMVFITCGLGGGTGSGAAPIVAQIAKSQNALTLAVATKPFAFEGAERAKIASLAWQELASESDSIITIPNDRIFNLISRATSLSRAFWQIDEILRQGVQGISGLITRPGLINVDFADVKAILSNSGSSLLGIGQAFGANRALEAARLAIHSPLLEVVIDGAKSLLFAVAGQHDMAMTEVHEIAQVVTESIDPAAKVIFGTALDARVGKKGIRVTVIATGFDPSRPSSKIVTNHTTPLLRAESTNETEELLESVLKPYAGLEEPAFLRKKKTR